jgi:uncharacterized membrane protein
MWFDQLRLGCFFRGTIIIKTCHKSINKKFCENYLFSVNRSQMVAIPDKNSLISIRILGLKTKN